ncbi:MAG: dihydrolipoamide acetyltransferase family protein [Actinomycetota bacterium]
MSQHVIKVPDVGEGVAEVELVAWTVAVGDQVVRNQVLAEVMTDKANVEIPAPVDGVIAGLNGDIGEIMAVGSDLIHIATGAGAGTAAPPPAVPAPKPRPTPVEPEPPAAPEAATPEPTPPAATGVNPFASTSQPVPAPVPAPAPEPAAEAPSDSPSEAPPDNDLPEGAVAAPVPGSDPTTASPGGTTSTTSPGSASSGADELVNLPPVEADPAAGEGGQAPGGEGWPSAASTNGSTDGGVRATPAVRARARRLGIDLGSVTGTGPQRRITHADLDDLLLGSSGASSVVGPAPAGASASPLSTPSTGPVPAPAPAASSGEVRPLVGLRRQIAQRMVAATTTIPHITYVDEVDVTAVEELRATLNAGTPNPDDPDRPKLTFLPFLIKAMVAALADHRGLNAHVDDEAGSHIVFDTVDVGIAAQTDRGLLVPVVRNAGARSLWDLAAEVGRLANAARDRSIDAADLSGSTITISSLGALGGLVTTPVLNKPEVAIVGVNKIATRPVWDGNGFTPRRMMNLSSSFDHRVVDGYDAAAFIGEVRKRLEQPALLFGADDPAGG